jgi:hypothetical protein
MESNFGLRAYTSECDLRRFGFSRTDSGRLLEASVVRHAPDFDGSCVTVDGTFADHDRGRSVEVVGGSFEGVA